MSLSNENLLQVLKQFITATVSQATANMATKDDTSRLSGQITDLDLKLVTIADAHTENLQDHESRLTRLEQSPA